MGSSSMKVHQFTRGLWEHEPSLSLNGCKRLRPLAPKLQLSQTTTTTTTNTSNETSSVTSSLDLKSFIRADSGPRKPITSLDQDPKRQSLQVEAQSGGTRWNPTQEQIGILEMLYKGGMRTPNANQIEQITAQLSKYGKIEGKNVFYWFQNHKARERQKQKRSSLGLAHSPRTPPPFTPITLDANVGRTEREIHEQEDSEQYYKRKNRSWRANEYYNNFEPSNDKNILCRLTEMDEEEANKTLELFPLHPERG